MMWHALSITDETTTEIIYKEAPTISEAIAEARFEMTLKGQRVSIAGRKVIGTEWDCDSWTISGHKPHGRAH